MSRTESGSQTLSAVSVLCGDHLDFAVAALVRAVVEQLEPGWELSYHLLIERVSPDTAERLQTRLATLPVRLHLHPVGDQLRDFADSPIPGAVTRLLLADYLPPTLDRVLYLDLDLLVEGSLLPLWQMELDGHPLAAVSDPFARRRFFWAARLAQDAQAAGLSRCPTEPYFNSGVMLIDLAQWRREQVGTRAIALLRAHPDGFPLEDQDALNLILQGRILALSPRWNLVEPITQLWDWDHQSYQAWPWADWLLSPAIRHFAGQIKPWSLLARRSIVLRYFSLVERAGFSDRAPVPHRRWWEQALQSWLDYHWLTVRAFSWPASPELRHRWWQATRRQPTWLALYPAYALRLLALALGRKLQSAREKARSRGRHPAGKVELDSTR